MYANYQTTKRNLESNTVLNFCVWSCITYNYAFICAVDRRCLGKPLFRILFNLETRTTAYTLAHTHGVRPPVGQSTNPIRIAWTANTILLLLSDFDYENPIETFKANNKHTIIRICDSEYNAHIWNGMKCFARLNNVRWVYSGGRSQPTLSAFWPTF